MAIRPGMIWLVNHLRTLIDDQRETYLDDETLEALLDQRSREHRDCELEAIPRWYPEGLSYVDFQGPKMLEGPPNIELFDGSRNTLAFPVVLAYGSPATGLNVGTAVYVDLRLGRFRFQGTAVAWSPVPQGPQRPIYLNGRSYDVYGAAADALEIQAAQVSQDFDFQTEGVSYSRSQKHEQLTKQAERYRSMSCTAVSFAEAVRRDAN